VSDTQFVTEVGAPTAGEGLAKKTITRVAAQANPYDDATTLILPVRGLNIPFADVALEEGDSVIVEAPSTQYVSVVGLVRAPGNFPHPPDAQLNLIRAVAMAGGLDLTADPQYVSVYRLSAEGTVASLRVRLINPGNEAQLTEALALPLKPGDVVSVEHTLRTRANIFLDRVFRISLGLYMSPRDLWDDN
jgi:protein involved in polysaccharide export with SLBB domain